LRGFDVISFLRSGPGFFLIDYDMNDDANYNHRKSPLLIQLFSATLCGILCLCWIPIHTAPLTIFFAIIYGVASGAFLGLMPAGTAALTTDMRYLGVRTGIVFSVAGISNLIGNPVAGKIVGSYGYTAAKVWAGCCMMIGSAILVWMVLGKKKAQPQTV
jgi:MFS family permease